MRHFLYLRGRPGVGKITVARLLEQDLGWRVFWFHDLKNSIFNIVQVHRIPRLMDEVTGPVVRFLLEDGQDIIYVRPSPDRETVDGIRGLVRQYPDYEFHPVQLVADYDTLLTRVLGRDDPYRIGNRADLDDYLKRSMVDVDGELMVGTDGLTPPEVARAVMKALSLESVER